MNSYVCRKKNGTLFLFTLLFLFASIANGAEIHVTTVKDFVQGSLRAALIIANSNHEHDTIYLPAGTYFLSGQCREDNNTGGDLDFNSDQYITISGSGKAVSIIDAAQCDRVFHILKGKVTVKNVTLKGGKSPLLNPSDYITRSEPGGAVLNKGQLIMENCIISDNYCDRAYGLSENGKGGAIYNEGTMVMTSCDITDNRAADGTGGIYNSNGGDGGAVYNKGTARIEKSLFARNRAGHAGAGRDGGGGGAGGAIFNDKTGILIISDTVITSNSSGSANSANRYIGNGGSGGGISSHGALTMNRCAVIMNATGNGGDGGMDFMERPGNGGFGGGIYLGKDSAQVLIQNSTISNNLTGSGANAYTDDVAGGFGGYGGGIYADCAARISYCTIAANTTGTGGQNGAHATDEPGHGGLGGGIYANTRINLQGCLLGDNTIPSDTSPTGKSASTIPNDFAGSLLSNGYNLIEFHSAGTTYTTGANGGTDIFAKDPLLAALAQNGGTTWTHALKPGSPAIDAGNKDSGAQDQRGETRPWDASDIPNAANGADIGAYELHSAASVSGRVTQNGAGVPNVDITFSNNGGAARTDPSGYYFQPVPTSWSGTITPQKEDLTFSPATLALAPVSTNITGKNFTATALGLTVRISSPANGALINGVTAIRVKTTEQSRNNALRITGVQFYINNQLTATDDTAPYEYLWDPRSLEDGDYIIKATAVNASGSVASHSIAVRISKAPRLEINPTALTFSVATGNDSLWRGQELNITDTNDWRPEWTIIANVDWLFFTPISGRGSAQVWVYPTGLTKAGVYKGALKISCPSASNPVVTVPVTVTVITPGSGKAPFGSFDSPAPDTRLSGSVAFTGWALDDRGIDYIAIYRDHLPSEGKDKALVGYATRVLGARPDVQAMHPNYPESQKAGWGYMMLTNMLPNGGNGTFTFHAIACDLDGKQTILGSRKLVCDNAHATRPFGAIDNPSPGAVLHNSTYINAGWVLTPPPNIIPQDGSTITVWVDGQPAGHPTYNIYREDIANLFPQYENSRGAAAIFTLDTRKLASGMHTLAWSATDSAGNIDGVGSRYFQVFYHARQNNHSESATLMTDTVGNPNPDPNGSLFQNASPWSLEHPLKIKKGFNRKKHAIPPLSPSNPPLVVSSNEMEPLEIQLAPFGTPEPLSKRFKGALNINGAAAALPIGSQLNEQTGVFSWLPGPGFAGDYAFTFIRETNSGTWEKIFLTIRIQSKK